MVTVKRLLGIYLAFYCSLLYIGPNRAAYLLMLFTNRKSRKVNNVIADRVPLRAYTIMMQGHNKKKYLYDLKTELRQCD